MIPWLPAENSYRGSRGLLEVLALLAEVSLQRRSTIQCPFTFLAFVPHVNFICSWALPFLISPLWVWTPVLQLCDLPMFLVFAISLYVFRFLKKLLAKASKAKFLLNSLVFLHNTVAGYKIFSVLFKNQLVFSALFLSWQSFRDSAYQFPK